MNNYKVNPLLESIKANTYNFDGEFNIFLQNIVNQWILPLPYANPAILEMFFDRDKKPYRDFLPWSGEFAGKYITSAVCIYRLTKDESLRNQIDWFVNELTSLQCADGYLGPYSKDCRLTGKARRSPYSQSDDNEEYYYTWDAWGHYHIMLGLIMWYEETQHTKSLDCATRIADLLCNNFLYGGKRLSETGWNEMNHAPIHAFCLLYKITAEERYMKMALEIENDFEAPTAGDYIRTALDGIEFFQSPKPRWESLHSIQAICELYFITGEERYKKAYEHIWSSILKTDRHNTGAFSTGEGACGNPYKEGAIETCCTIAWMALSVDMLRLTGDSTVADELELSMLNAANGAISPTGKWCTYDTPMDGFKFSSQKDIVFQSRAGSPELNCCSVNSARGPGMLADWAIMKHDKGVAINYYGMLTVDFMTESSNRIVLKQDTSYPKSGEVNITVINGEPESLVLKLRIPKWSKNTTILVNGTKCNNVICGRYFEIERIWKKHDKVTLNLDMSIHYAIGENECKGKTSIYRGPILLAFDAAYNDVSIDDIPQIDALKIEEQLIQCERWIKPDLLVECGNVRLCDYRSAGFSGTPYKSWLKVANVPL